MIQKISTNEYLKRADNMTAGERQALAERVGRWMRSAAKMLMGKAEDPEAQLQNVMQVSARWNDAEIQAWNEGAMLLTAFASTADTWLPERLYVKAAGRSIHRMVMVLKKEGRTEGAAAAQQQAQPTEARKADGKKSGRITAGTAKEAGYGKVAKEEPAAGTVTATQAVATKPLPSGGRPLPVRPKHIDQYVHILPEKTQERAAQYGPLMRDMEAARENMRLLMNDPKASNADRARWAKVATSIDRELKGIREELDKEWEKAVKEGKVTVDDLGQAHVVAVTQQHTQQATTEPKGEATEPKGAKTEPKGETTEPKGTAEVKARVKALRTALRDTRGPKEPGKKRDAYVKKWKEKYRKMVAIGGKEAVTEAVQNAAKLYGINLAELDKE